MCEDATEEEVKELMAVVDTDGDGKINIKGNHHIQYNFSGSNTDGSFTTAVSNSILDPLEQSPQLQIIKSF